MQLLPPPEGGGLLHFLALVLVPLPQVAEHSEYGPQHPHSPLATMKSYVKALEKL